jgi:catechol 2,3-dioxygenase-like lactoylglutathione lyase family enzyme
MIGYVTLGTNDRERAARFYDALMAELGASRVMDNEQFIAWGAPGQPGLGITRPFDGRTASVGNGVMVALTARDQAQVDRLHAIALSHGGGDEGAPGERWAGFYVAYFRDPDGNKLNVHVAIGNAVA